MKKVNQTETTFNRSMGIIKEMENVFRKETRKDNSVTLVHQMLGDMTTALEYTRELKTKVRKQLLKIKYWHNIK